MQRKEADFDVRRYFQSILSPDTVKMYSFLLSSYRENSPKVNHYIHSFFYRAKHFKIYQHEDWTMQPLLFNIHVLLLFNRMLQDASIQRQADMKSFLDFIRGVVRDLFALAEKNHLLFVEALLRQPYAAKSALLLQRNYEPHDSMTKSRSEAVALGREKQIELINEVRRQKKAIDAEELEGEEEFQFTLGPADFEATSLIAAKKRKAQKKKKSAEATNDENENGENEEEEEDDDDDEEAEFGGDLQKAPSKDNANGVEVANDRAKKTRAASERAKNWTKVEDRYLEKMFGKYRHLPSVYEVISYEDMFQDRDRTAEQIERRVKYLKLHRKTHDSSDEDDDGRVDDDAAGEKKFGDERNDSDLNLDMELGIQKPHMEEQQESSRPRRRLRRVTTLSDDSDSEDDLLQTGAKSKLSSPIDEGMGSHSPSSENAVASYDGDVSAAVEGTSDMQDMETVEDEAHLDVADETQHSDEVAPEDESDTQMVEEETEAAGLGATQAIAADDDEEATQAIADNDDEYTQMIDDEAETELVQSTIAGDVDEVDEPPAAVDSTQDDDADTHTQVLEGATQANTVTQDEDAEVASAPTVSSPVSNNKRARDPTDDDETSGDAEMNGSPQKKVVRTAVLDEEVPTATEN